MKGLLLKDYYTLSKQLKLYLVFILVLSAIPEMNLSAIASIYAAMLPITAIAFDERSKWDQLAVMMPYSKRNLVMSKYVIGYIGVVVCYLLSLGIQLVISAVTKQPFTAETALVIVITACVALILLAINLPIMFWLGVERGRIVFMVLIAVTVFVGMMSAESATNMLSTSSLTAGMLLGISALAAAIVNLVSILISFRFYEKKKF
jgi:hypothetical protein